VPSYQPPPDPEERPEPVPRHEAEAQRRRRAELAAAYEVDMVAFGPEEHDERIELRGWVYYVRAVPWGRPLSRSPAEDKLRGDLGGLVVLGVVKLVRLGLRQLGRARPWRVGVVRGASAASWNPRDLVVLHEETLERGQDPVRRVGELAADVRAGRWPDPPAG
jgi:hypothetical protein